MGWNYAIKPTKGLLANTLWTHGDIGTTLTFSDYTTDYNAIPLTGVQAEKSPVEFQGYHFNMPNLLEGFLSGQTSANNVLLAAFNVNPQGGQSGAYLCFIMDVSQYTHSGNENWCRLRLRISKRLYDYAGTSYTETWPMGNTAQDGEYIFTSDVVTDPYRKGPDFVIFLKTATYSGVENIVAGWAHATIGGYAECYGSGMAYRMKKSFFNSSVGWGESAEIPEAEAESPEFGPAAQPGGYVGSQQGTHDKSTEHSGIPTKPQYGFTSAGFLNHYLITSQGLEQLGEAVFPEPAGLSTSVEQAIDRLVTNQWNSKLVDYIIDCRIIPVMPHDSGYHDLSVGGKVLIHPDTQAIYRAALIDEDFVDVNCGTITTDLVEGNFLDFYNMSAKLFLPFYGFVDIAPEYWMGATLGVQYRFNMMDGSFMVWITSKAFGTDMNTDDVIAQYAGNACIHLPINTQSYGNIISGMITTGAAIVGAAATGGPLGVAGAMASGAANIINSRPQLNANNTYNGSAALMSKRTPYLLIEFNNAQFSTRYVEEQGLPLVVTRTLGTLTGMTVCMDPVINFACADDEAAEILGLLKSGVIL